MPQFPRKLKELTMPTDPQVQEAYPEALSPAAKRLQAVQEEILARRNRPVPVYIPPAPAPAIAEKTRLEMEEGAKRVAMAEEAKMLRPAPKPDKGAGTTVPVYRPKEFVPNMNQGQQANKSYKGL